MIGRLLGPVLLVPALAGAQTPSAPKLGAAVAPTVVMAPDAAAQRLPSLVTICSDRPARRCWTVAGASDCDGHERIATVRADAPEAGAQLRACWDALPHD